MESLLQSACLTAGKLYLLGFVNGAVLGAFLMLLAALWVAGATRPRP